VNADAPSGLGFNAAMAVINTLIGARMTAPATPADGDAPVWDSASSTWKSNATAKKIAMGGLASYPFVNADVAAAAAIAVSKLAAGSNGQVLTTTGGVPVWGAGGSTVLKKTAITDVVNSLAVTDILAGVGVLPILTTTSIIRVKLWGDRLNNTGAGHALTLEVKLGATTIWKDTFNAANDFAAATKRAWTLDLEIVNNGATSSQTAAGLYVLGAETAPTTGFGGGNSGAISWTPSGTANKALGVTLGGSAAEDTTVSKTLVVNVTHDAANALLSQRCTGALIEVL